MPFLHESNALGIYPTRVEFQLDRTIINVIVPADGNRDESLERADRLLGDVWAATGHVLAMAMSHSAQTLEPFWTAHLGCDTVHEHFLVLGIQIHPAAGSASYHVGCRCDCAGVSGLDELLDDYSASVYRAPNGELEFEG